MLSILCLIETTRNCRFRNELYGLLSGVYEGSLLEHQVEKSLPGSDRSLKENENPAGKDLLADPFQLTTRRHSKITGEHFYHEISCFVAAGDL